MRYVALFVVFLVAFSATSSLADIRLNELLADPASDWDGDAAVNSRDDEWVEIVNTGVTTIDVSTCRLADASGGFEWRFAFSGTLAPGETRVVYGSEAHAWQTVTGRPAMGLSLNNAGDTVTLYSVAGGDTTVLDAYTYDNVEVADDRSAGRNPDGDGPWVVFDALNPYTGAEPPTATGCAPSPGAPNCTTILPTESATWGAIKDLYRN